MRQMTMEMFPYRQKRSGFRYGVIHGLVYFTHPSEGLVGVTESILSPADVREAVRIGEFVRVKSLTRNVLTAKRRGKGSNGKAKSV